MKNVIAIFLIGLLTLLSACTDERTQSVSNRPSDASIVSVTGELHSSESKLFGPPTIADTWTYTIASMVPDGSVVKKGQPILRFDTQALETKLRTKANKVNQKNKELQKQEVIAREQLAELSLAIEEARAARDKAALKADIPETLLAKRAYDENKLVLKQATLNLALKQDELGKEENIQSTEIRILESEIAVLDAEIKVLEQSIKSMRIRAPDDGVVIHATDHRGNKLEVGGNVWGGRRVMEFPVLSKLEVRLEIPERESARISIGQPVSLTLDAVPNRPFSGEIISLASVIRTRSINQPAKVFDAIVALNDPDPELMRPGMSVNAQIRTSSTLASTP